MYPSNSPASAVLAELRDRAEEVEAPRLARQYLRALEAEGLAPWLDEQLRLFLPSPELVGAIILSGEGRLIAAALDRHLRRQDASGRLLLEIDSRQLRADELIVLGWLRLMRDEWSRLPEAPRGSRLPTRTALVDHFLRNLLSGLEKRNLAAVQKAIAETRNFSDSGPSLLGAAILSRFQLIDPVHQVLPPLLPDGFFYAENDSTLRDENEGASHAPGLESPFRVAQLQMSDGSLRPYAIERLSCGHRRVESLTFFRPTGMRLCRLCRAGGEMREVSSQG